MYEGLNHWGFVAASYAITVAGTALLVISSLVSMRRAESRRSQTDKAASQIVAQPGPEQGQRQAGHHLIALEE